MQKKIFSRKTILVRHNDFDGVSCEILLKASGIRPVLVLEADYKNVNKLVNSLIDTYGNDEDYVLLITDISIDEETAKRLDEAKINKALIDHHKTAKWLDEKYDWAVVDTAFSGAMLLFWSLADSKIMPKDAFEKYRRFAHLANDYDMWIHEEPDSRKLNDLMYLIGKDRFVEDMLKVDSIQYLTDEHKRMLDIETERKNRYISKTPVTISPVTFFGKQHIVAYCFADEYTSDLCHSVLEKHTKADIVVAISLRNEKVSLRSRGDVDCSDIALIYGGGGHKSASGFEIDKSVTEMVFNHLFNKKN